MRDRLLEQVLLAVAHELLQLCKLAPLSLWADFFDGYFLLWLLVHVTISHDPTHDGLVKFPLSFIVLLFQLADL